MPSHPRSTALSLLVISLALNARAHAADGPWFTATSDSAVVFSNDSRGAAARLLVELAAARAVMKQVVDVESQLPVRVFAVKDEASLRELVPQYWERRGVRPQAASYAGPYTAFIAVRADLPVPLRFPMVLHEYVHLLTAARLPDAPAWLDEGLSEFWGSLVLDGNQIVIGRPLASHLKLLRTRKWLSLKDVLRRERGKLGGDQAEVSMFYAQSWAMVHYLLLGRSATAPLAFAPADHQRAPQFETAIRTYVSDGRFREVAVPSSHASASPQVALPISEARALAERANMLVFGERPDAALPLVRRALAIEPRQRLALEVMGTYFFQRNEPERAREWLDRALEADPASHGAALYLALLTSSPTERERYLTTAVRAKPDFTLAWQRLWTVYEEDGRAESARLWCDRLRGLSLRWLSVDLSPDCGLQDQR